MIYVLHQRLKKGLKLINDFETMVQRRDDEETAKIDKNI